MIDMGTAREVLTWAASQIGVKENPAGSNRVPFWDYYEQCCGVNYQGQPWCACFSTGNAYPRHKVWSFTRDEGRFRYCPSIVSWAKANGQWRTRSQGGQPGDQAVFGRYGIACHVGLVEKVLSGTKYQTIEGNTSITSNDNGGAVMRRTRELGTEGSSWYIMGFVRPAWSADATNQPLTATDSKLEQIANEVIDGKWGNNPERAQRLKAAGYDPEAVRRIVNIKLDVKNPAPTKPAEGYQTGTYQVQVSTYLYVRTGPGTNYRAKTKSEVTPDAQKHWKGNGLANGTRVTVSEIKTTGNEVWGRGPSGWICIKQNDSTFAKRV